MIVDALWYVPNTVIRRDLQTPTVKEDSKESEKVAYEGFEPR
jgi:hypothetical protein